jgi:hypothetical protein
MLLCSVMLVGKAAQALTATLMGTGLIAVGTWHGDLLNNAAVLALYVVPIILVLPPLGSEIVSVTQPHDAEVDRPMSSNMCYYESMGRSMQLGDLYKISEGGLKSCWMWKETSWDDMRARSYMGESEPMRF